MAYQWTTNTATPITVDGQFGPQTVKALQYGLGVTADGSPGPVTIKALQTFLGVTADGSLGPITVKALQTKLKVSVDGDWGPATTRQLQAALNAGALGGAVPMPAPVTVAAGGFEPIAESSVSFARYTGGGSVSQWIASGMAAAGVSGSDWSSGLNIIITHESSGNPNAVNGYDSNSNGPIQSDNYPLNCSRGVCQDIPSTFAGNHIAGTSNMIYDPVAGVAASCHYINAVYGGIDNVPGVRSVRAGNAYLPY